MTRTVLDLLASAAGAVDAALGAVADPPGDDLVEVLGSAESLSRKAHALALATTAAVESSGAARELGYVTPALLLSSVLRVSAHEARTRVAHAALVGPRRALTGEALAPALPATAAAVADGAIGPAHLRIIEATVAAIPAATGPADRAAAERALAEAARRFDPKRLQVVADRVLAHLRPDGDPLPDDEPAAPAAGAVRWRRRRDGRYALDGWLEAVPGAALDALLAPLSAPRPAGDGAPDPRTAEQRTADALVEVCDLARSAADAPTSGAEPPHVTITVPLETLQRGALSGVAGGGATGGGAAGGAEPLLDLPGVPAPRDGRHPLQPSRRPGGEPGGACPLCGDPVDGAGRCRRTGAVLDHGTLIAAAETRLAACDARVVPVVLGADSAPLDVGRAARTVPPALRRAVVARDGGCTFPGCDRPPQRCHVHHVEHWVDLGESSLENCVLLCAAHHRLVHATGWGIAIRGGTVEYTPPATVDPERRPLRNDLHCLVVQRC